MATLQAVRRANGTLEDLRALHRKLMRDLQSSDPPASSLGAHLLSLKDPKTGQPLNDYQLEAEMALFILAGTLYLEGCLSTNASNAALSSCVNRASMSHLIRYICW